VRVAGEIRGDLEVESGGLALIEAKSVEANFVTVHKGEGISSGRQHRSSRTLGRVSVPVTGADAGIGTGQRSRWWRQTVSLREDHAGSTCREGLTRLMSFDDTRPLKVADAAECIGVKPPLAALSTHTRITSVGTTAMAAFSTSGGYEASLHSTAILGGVPSSASASSEGAVSCSTVAFSLRIENCGKVRRSNPRQSWHTVTLVTLAF
jgi:hypothetical protein